MAGKQAKILSEQQQRAVLAYLDTTRHPLRNRVMFLLSVKAGFRAKEVACLQWRHVTDAEGSLSDEITIEDKGSKGKNGGRTVPTARVLKDALAELAMAEPHEPHQFVIQTERAKSGVAPQTIIDTFARWYTGLGFDGCSSHSGRRTFITNAAKKITTVGGSLRDVQALAGHKSLQTTQRYIEGDVEARRKIVNLI